MEEPEDGFVTLRTFSSQSEIMILQSLLQAEGIRFYFQNENTALTTPWRAYNFASISLQVWKDDLEKAKEILQQRGYLSERDATSFPGWLTRFIRRINSFTKPISFLHKLSPANRFGILFIGAIMVIGASALLFNSKLPPESITDKSWCVDYIFVDNILIQPKTIYSGFRIVMNGQCEETMDLNKNGEMKLPGIHTAAIYGQWKIADEQIHFSSLSALDSIYSGSYQIWMKGRELKLSSQRVKIHGWLENNFSAD